MKEQVYAWHDPPCDLGKHCFNVLKLFTDLFYSLPSLLAKKISILTGNKEDEKAKELIKLAIFFHDVGKGLNIYQLSVKESLEGKRKKPSFVWHEVISAYIYKEYCLRSFDKYIKYNSIKLSIGLGYLAILHHHHAMRIFHDVQIDKAVEDIKNVSKMKSYEKVRFTEEAMFNLSSYLESLGYKKMDIIKDILLSNSFLNDVIRNVKNDLKFKVTGSINIIKEILCEHEQFLKLHEILTSHLVVSDLLTASIERKRPSNYVKKLTKELNITGEKLEKLIDYTYIIKPKN